ncbi:MAG TPA: YdcF family protein [Gemmatimonadaceae bacterium]|jgi:uncharacterized SAM-binding protein YcdF (DUF218 family)|nr:YdcF family protein [Gemmatimonadaceae bacterium]
MRRRTHRRVRIAGALAALIVLAWVGTVIAVLVVGRRDDARSADAIVVLGAAQYEGRPSPVLRARLDHVLELWRRGVAPVVIVTGGTGVGDTTSEAMVSRRYLLQRGVPDSVVIMETHGLTTIQSLRAVSSIVAALPGRSVILVSDPFHMLRLSILARHLGLRPFTSPTRTSPISASAGVHWKYVLSESVKVPLTLLLELSDN